MTRASAAGRRVMTGVGQLTALAFVAASSGTGPLRSPRDRRCARRGSLWFVGWRSSCTRCCATERSSHSIKGPADPKTGGRIAFLTTEPNAIVAPIHAKTDAGHFDHARGDRCLDDGAHAEGPEHYSVRWLIARSRSLVAAGSRTVSLAPSLWRPDGPQARLVSGA